MTNRKIRLLSDGEWKFSSFPKTYIGENGRLVLGVNDGDMALLKDLVSVLASPVYVLYVLHTARGEADTGRYQSPALTTEDVISVLEQNEEFLLVDSRFDLWVHSPGDGATVVLDRHNYVFLYGLRAIFEARLQATSFVQGGLPDIGSHRHSYLAEFDSVSASLLNMYDWRFSALHPEDEQ